MAKYLVLGSSGQIGSALSFMLRALGHSVIPFDLTNGSNEDIRLHRNQHLDHCVRQCDLVFFLAFDVGGSRYLKAHQCTPEFLSNNMRIMEHAFQCVHEHRKPVIFASSQMVNAVHSQYGALKEIGEYYCRAIDGLAVRLWNVYGAERNREKFHVVTDFIVKARDTGIIDMITDGEERRQMLYVEDCCKCLGVLAQRYSDIPREAALHVTSFRWHQIIEVAETVAKNFPGATIVRGNISDQTQLALVDEPDPFILKYWRPETSLQDGVARIAALHLQAKITKLASMHSNNANARRPTSSDDWKGVSNEVHPDLSP